jgi:hypothetical protein
VDNVFNAFRTIVIIVVHRHQNRGASLAVKNIPLGTNEKFCGVADVADVGNPRRHVLEEIFYRIFAVVKNNPFHFIVRKLL